MTGVLRGQEMMATMKMGQRRAPVVSEGGISCHRACDKFHVDDLPLTRYSNMKAVMIPPAKIPNHILGS